MAPPPRFAPGEPVRLSVVAMDEFAEYQVSYGYPAEVGAAAEAECAQVVDEIRSGATTFAAVTADPWRAAFRALPSR